MEKLLRLSLSISIISSFALPAPSIATESTAKPRTVRTIPWGRDGNPKGVTGPDRSAPLPTPRPHQSELPAITVLDGDWCIPGNGCTGPEPITREGFHTCEEYCALSNPVPFESFNATLFDISCKGDSSEGSDYRMMLKEYEDNEGSRKAVIVDTNGVHSLEPCSDQTPNPQQSASQCDFNSRLYRAKPGNVGFPDRYHELQLVDGFTEGVAAITEYREGKAIWRATGEHVCSNGAVICRFLFPTMTGEAAEAPFEVLLDERGDYKTIVAPAFSQNVYLSERYATLHHGKSYGGLVAEFMNGFTPSENDLLLPRNVYEFAGCAD